MKYIKLSEALKIGEKKVPGFSAGGFRRYIRSESCPIKTRRSSLGARAHYEIEKAGFDEYLAELTA